jgi:hypothetical protein
MELLVATTEHNSELSLCCLQQRRDATRPEDSKKEKEGEEAELLATTKGGEDETVAARQQYTATWILFSNRCIRSDWRTSGLTASLPVLIYGVIQLILIMLMLINTVEDLSS